ncbi:MAG: hypothetical protein IPO25_11165 [Saprospiraceae bacterium]|nr:hypothetical protein [Saprospiraceae bacterium]
MQKFITLYKNLNSTEDELSRTTMVQGYLSELSDVEKKPAISLLLNQKNIPFYPHPPWCIWLKNIKTTPCGY